MYVQEFLFYGIILIIIVRYITICIKYPFWAHMPVYHTYDYHHIFSKSCREMQLFPYKNKFSIPIQIKTISYYELNDTYKKYFAELLQCFYIPSDSILYTIVEKDIKACFSGHYETPFISFYNEKNFISTNTTVEIGLFPEPKGCIGSYPVHTFYHLPGGQYKSANYFTYISTHRSYKNQNISRSLISTHDYNIRRHNPDVRVGLLKKDIGLCEGVVPLITFSTCLFHINPAPNKIKQIIQIYKQNWDILATMMEIITKPNSLYDFVATIDIGAIKARIDAEILFVYAFYEKGNLLAIYFIEDAHMLYEKTSEKTLRLVASINNGLSPIIFYNSFMDCLRKIMKRNLDFKLLLSDNIGHNALLMNMMMNQKVEETSGAYYFINWLFPFKADREKSFFLL